MAVVFQRVAAIPMVGIAAWDHLPVALAAACVFAVCAWIGPAFRPVRRRPVRLTVDGRVAGEFRTLEEARDAAPGRGDEYVNWSIDKLVGSRYFNYDFGFSGGATSREIACLFRPVPKKGER